MKCAACEKQGLDHDDIVQKCLSTPWYTGRMVLGYNLLNSFLHENMARWYVESRKAGHKNHLILIPRDHLKTSFFGCAVPIWHQLHEPEQRMLYVMSACSEANKTFGVVRRAFKGDFIRHFFPSRALDPRTMVDTQTYFTLPRAGDYREYSLEARGVDSTVTGGHFTIQIFDDLIDKTMANSIVEQEKVILFHRDAINMFVDQSVDERIIIGTLWEGEYYDWLLNSGATDDYHKLILGCIADERYFKWLEEMGVEPQVEEGQPIWPERYTLETLERIQREQGPIQWNRQWLNIAAQPGEARFSKEDFKYYHMSPDGQQVVLDDEKDSSGNPIHIPLHRLWITTCVDPGSGEHQKTDDTAIVTCGYDYQTGYVLVLEAKAGKWLPARTINEIIQTVLDWKPVKTGIEEAALQSVFRRFLMPELAQRRAYTTVIPLKPQNRSKITRIDGLQPFVANGQVFVQKRHTRLINELCNLNVQKGKVVGKSPNLADALAYHVDLWRGRDITVDSDEDDIPYVDDPTKQRRRRSYGLECST